MIRILLAIWLAWQTASPEALQHMQAGAEAEKQRHFDVAIAEFKKVTELEPTLPEGFVNLGQAYMESSDLRRRDPAAQACSGTGAGPRRCPPVAGIRAACRKATTPKRFRTWRRFNEQTALGIAQIGTGQLQQAVANLQAALAEASQRSRFALLSRPRQRTAVEASD